MKIKYHRSFEKDFKKIPNHIKEKFFVRQSLFIKNLFSPLLHNHALTGEYSGYRSINITGDYRAIYEETDDGILFVKIGTHSELYQ